MIEILHPTKVARAMDTGALVAGILETLKSRSTVGTNLLDIDRWAKALILEAGARSCYVDYAPSFGRRPFGHYIPSERTAFIGTTRRRPLSACSPWTPSR